MAGPPVEMSDLRFGLPVEYRGERDPNVVLSPELTSVGMALLHGHPGRVRDTTIQHVQVDWVGLVDEPASYAVGFTANSADDLIYGTLAPLTEDEYERRRRDIENALATGQNLRGWDPGWSHPRS